MWVVVFHKLTSNRADLVDLPKTVSNLILTGYAAVSVFFVLSGFVLAYSYNLDHRWSKQEYWRFAAARFARIYPSYLLGLVLLMPLFAWRFFDNWYLIDPLKEAGIAVLNFTLLQTWLPSTALTWNDPGWSLSNEAFFYACFPIIGVLLWRATGTAKLLGVGLLLWALSLAAPIAGILIPIHGYGDIAARVPDGSVGLPDLANIFCMNPLMRIPEFCVGILLERVFSNLQNRGSSLFGRGYYLYLPAILAVVLVLSQADRIPFPTVHHGLLLPAYSCIILGFALDGGLLARFLSIRSMVFLGNASYSVYILHVPILTWLAVVGKRVGFQTDEGAPVFFSLFVVLLISCLNYAFLEEPLHKRIKNGLQARLQGKSTLVSEKSER